MSLSRRSLRTNAFTVVSSVDSGRPRPRAPAPALTTLAGTTTAPPDPAVEPAGPVDGAEPPGVPALPAGATGAAALAPPAPTGAAGAPIPGGGSIIAAGAAPVGPAELASPGPA